MNTIKKIFLLTAVYVSCGISNYQFPTVTIRDIILCDFLSPEAFAGWRKFIIENFINDVQSKDFESAKNRFAEFGMCFSLRQELALDGLLCRKAQEALGTFIEEAPYDELVSDRETVNIVLDFVQNNNVAVFDEIIDTIENELEQRYIVFFPSMINGLEELNKKIASYSVSESDFINFMHTIGSIAGHGQKYKFFMEAQLYFFIPKSTQAVRMNTIMKRYREKEEEITTLLAEKMHCINNTILNLETEKINSPFLATLKQQSGNFINQGQSCIVGPEVHRSHELEVLQQNYKLYTKFYYVLIK